MARLGLASNSILSIELGAGLLERASAARMAAGLLERGAGAERRRCGGLIVELGVPSSCYGLMGRRGG